jgi:hypothetical protein
MLLEKLLSGKPRERLRLKPSERPERKKKQPGSKLRGRPRKLKSKESYRSELPKRQPGEKLLKH